MTTKTRAIITMSIKINNIAFYRAANFSSLFLYSKFASQNIPTDSKRPKTLVILSKVGILFRFYGQCENLYCCIIS